MLRVSLLGNLGADAELRYSQKGTPMASFRVAVKQVRTGAEGERQENTEWFRVRAMGRLAEFAQHLGKGARVLVVGRLDVTHFQSREGEPRVGFDVWADEVLNLSSRPSGGEADGAEPELSGVAPGAAGDRGQGAAGPPAERGKRPVAANGARGRAPVARPEAEPEELEDLPF